MRSGRRCTHGASNCHDLARFRHKSNANRIVKVARVQAERGDYLGLIRLVKKRYHVGAFTIWRWDQDPRLTFPKPIRIRGQKFHCEAELDAFDARLKEGSHVK